MCHFNALWIISRLKALLCLCMCTSNNPQLIINTVQVKRKQIFVIVNRMSHTTRQEDSKGAHHRVHTYTRTCTHTHSERFVKKFAWHNEVTRTMLQCSNLTCGTQTFIKTYCRVQFRSSQGTAAYFANVFPHFVCPHHCSIGFIYQGNCNTLRVYSVHIWQDLLITQDTSTDRHIGPTMSQR